MKNTLKKFLACFLIFVICNNMPAVARAEEVVQDQQELVKSKISEVLYGFEMQKEAIGLENVDFKMLEMGKAIQTYIYACDEFEEGYIMYPILNNEDLVFWAIKTGDTYQLTTALVDEVNQNITDETDFAIIYDKNSSYLYKENEFIYLATSQVEDDTRSVLDPEGEFGDLELKTENLLVTSSLGYVGGRARSYPYYECNVGFVSQIKGSSMCWAATIACIVNYRTGSNLSAVSVAKSHYGNSDYDRGLPVGVEISVLANYGQWYTYKNQVPSQNVIIANIQGGFPIYSSWTRTGVRHAVCIYGINAIGGYIYLMDPEFGFSSASSSGSSYEYIGSSGNALTLDYASCHTW